jgi:DNA-binding transcriptional LysR family regulator
MDQRQIERFVDVVESGSLTRTSRRLNISQPALSKSLRLLEERLGTKLLERGPRGVRATASGQVFYGRARFISAEFRRAQEDLDELKGNSGGELSLGVTPGPGVLDRILPEAVYRVAKKRPNLKFHVRSGTLSELLPSLNQGSLDILFTVLDETIKGRDLTWQLLFEDHFVLVTNRNHPLMKLDKITLQDLVAYQWVLLQDASSLWNSIEERAERTGLKPKADIESNSVMFVRRMASTTDCIGVLPSHAAELSVGAGDLVCVPNKNIAEPRLLPRLVRPMGLVHSAQTELTSGGQMLLRSITTVCHELRLLPERPSVKKVS